MRMFSPSPSLSYTSSSLFDSFVRVDVEEGQFAVRESACMRHRWAEQLATKQQKPDNRCFQERSAGPSPGILMLQRTAPGGSALQPSEKLAHLYQTAPGQSRFKCKGNNFEQSRDHISLRMN